jgi:hypothetical protein
VQVNAEDKIKNVSTIDAKENYNSENFSCVFGAGFLTPVGLGFDARVNAGLGNINEIENGRKTRGNVIQLGIFYQFNQ